MANLINLINPISPINPWLGIGFVLAMLGGLMSLLRLYKRQYSPHPELTRKLLHIGMGLTTLTFPWLFTSIWPIILLAGMTIFGLFRLRQSSRLKKHFGGVIDGVGRDDSLGEIYFPLGVATLFIISRGDPLLYSIPILLLALADAVAALIGVRYGQLRYTTTEDEKSAEGSIAFFITAFFSVHIPLLLFTATGRMETLLIALILGTLMMMVEAVAWSGLDNLFIPIIGYILLKTFLGMTGTELIVRLIITSILVLFVLFWRKQTNLNPCALLGAALVGYLSGILGGWQWLLAPFILFGSYIVILAKGNLNSLLSFEHIPNAVLRSRNKFDHLRLYNVQVVISVVSAGLIWLFLFRVLDRPELFYPFTLAFGAQLAIIGIAPLKHNEPYIPTLFRLGGSIIRGWLLLFIPFLLLEGFNDTSIQYTFIALLGISLAAISFYRTHSLVEGNPSYSTRWLRQAACPFLGSAVGLIPLYLV